jgi:sugar phosphate isomerase/epimerase
MSIKKSLVLSVAYPLTETNAILFAEKLKYLKGLGINTVEFFVPFEYIDSFVPVFRSSDLNGIYLAALYQKRNNFNLSSLEESFRLRSVDATEKCILAAVNLGAGKVLITSGRRPESDSRQGEAEDALKRSLRSLCDFAKDHNVGLLMEPGDRDVQAFQVVGSTKTAVELCSVLASEGKELSLTMDTSHTIQLNEDVRTALNTAKPFCRHIHLANCVLKPGHSLYGDKHPMLSDPEAELSFAEMQELGSWCKELYNEEELTLSVEVICHESDQERFFEKLLREEKWFLAL